MTECCENCKYYRKLKLYDTFLMPVTKGGVLKYDEIKGRWTKSHCCVALIDEVDAFVLEVEPNDKCEVFEGKEQKE